jgi:hypothetical protein
MVRVGVKIPQDGNRANGYRRVYMVPGHVWRTLCSVCATGARVAQPFLQLVFSVISRFCPAHKQQKVEQQTVKGGKAAMNSINKKYDVNNNNYNNKQHNCHKQKKHRLMNDLLFCIMVTAGEAVWKIPDDGDLVES